MILIESKLKNDSVINIFNDLSSKIFKDIISQKNYKDTLCLFLNKEKNEISDLDLKKLVNDILTYELADLRRSNDYHIDFYIKSIFMKKTILKKIKDKGSFNQYVKPKIDRFTSLLNYSENYKNKFFPKFTYDEISEMKSKKKAKDFINKQFAKFDIIQENLLKMFNYDKEMTRERRVDMIRGMDVQVCPYCNFNNIPTSKEIPKTKVLTEADVDHFLPKKLFPLFSLSYGNFIPSCKPCNGQHKGSKIKDIVNPRFEEFGDYAIFKLNLQDSDFLEIYFKSNLQKISVQERGKISIYFKEQLSDIQKHKKIRNSINVFALDTKYNTNHVKDEVLNDIYKIKKYGSDSYKKLLKDVMEEDVVVVLFNLDRAVEHDDYINIPYSKLRFDIIKQYSELNKYYLNKALE